MPEVFFSFHQAGKSPSEMKQWSRMVADLQTATAHEFYRANIEMDIPPGDDTITLARTALGTIRIVQFHSPGISRTNRTAAHIKEDGTQDYIIWLVTCGALQVTQSGRTAMARQGQFVIMEAGRPFRIRTLSDHSEYHESYQIIVPQHSMARFIPDVGRYSVRAFDIAPGPAKLAYEIFSSLFDNADKLPIENANDTAEQALRLLAIAAEGAKPPGIGSAGDPVKDRIERFILAHFAEQGLTASRVAEGCNISLRLLHGTFKGRESFHSRILGMRLGMAAGLLSDPATRSLNISEIGYMCGFVSNAHFSRVFRNRFDCTPREYRRLSRDGHDPLADDSQDS